MPPRSLRPLVPLALCLAAGPALADQPDFFISGIGHAAGAYATSPAGTPAGSGDRWSAYAGYGVTGEMEVTTDSGIRYGLSGTIGSGDYERSLTRPGTNEVVTVSEAYLFVTSAWGSLRIGDEDGAAKRAVDLLPLIGGGQVDGYWTGIAGARPLLDHLGRTSDDATKVLYETPRLLGLRAGLSYAPERDSLVEDIDDLGFIPAEDDFWEAGLNYRGERGPVEYELAVGYAWADGGTAPAPGGSGGGLPVVPVAAQGTEQLTLAALAFYGGFSLSGQWFTGEVGLPGVGTSSGSDIDGWTLFGSYENGPYGIALWSHGQEVDRRSDHVSYGVGLSWAVRRELTLGLDAVRYENDPTGLARAEKGTAIQLSATARF
jgi:hypothetical protein